MKTSQNRSLYRSTDYKEQRRHIRTFDLYGEVLLILGTACVHRYTAAPAAGFPMGAVPITPNRDFVRSFRALGEQPQSGMGAQFLSTAGIA